MKILSKTQYGEIYLLEDKTVVKKSRLSKIDFDKENPFTETNILSKLSDSNYVVKYISSWNDQKYYYLKMEYLPYELFCLITEDKLSYINKKSIFKQLLLALKEIHGKGVYHLDISTENILLDEDLNVKLCDFGMSAVSPISTIYRKTRYGKLSYMCPYYKKSEIFDGAKCDIFAAGIVFFVMLTKHLPWTLTSDKDEHFKTIYTKGRLKFILDIWNIDLTNNDLEILKSTLCPPDERKNIDELLKLC